MESSLTSISRTANSNGTVREKFTSDSRHFGHALVYSDSTRKTRFGKVLNQIRLNLEISQNTVSLATGLDRTLICQYENGRKMPARETVDILCKRIPGLTEEMKDALYESAGFIPTDQWEKW